MDGRHVTLYRFTTGWKVRFDTPRMSIKEREDLAALPDQMSLFAAIQQARQEAQQSDDPIVSSLANGCALPPGSAL